MCCCDLTMPPGVSLQLLKVYALARVTPAALWQLLTSMGLNTGASAQPAAASQLAAGSAAASKAQSKQSRSSAAARARTTGAQVPASSGEAEGAVDAAAAAEPGSVPPDEVLSGSNIFSTAEACLLAWMNAHVVKAFPKLVSISTLSLQQWFVHNSPRRAPRHLHPNTAQHQSFGGSQPKIFQMSGLAVVGPFVCCSHCRTCV